MSTGHHDVERAMAALDMDPMPYYDFGNTARYGVQSVPDHEPAAVEPIHVPPVLSMLSHALGTLSSAQDDAAQQSDTIASNMDKAMPSTTPAMLFPLLVAALPEAATYADDPQWPAGSPLALLARGVPATTVADMSHDAVSLAPSPASFVQPFSPPVVPAEEIAPTRDELVIPEHIGVHDALVRNDFEAASTLIRDYFRTLPPQGAIAVAGHDSEGEPISAVAAPGNPPSASRETHDEAQSPPPYAHSSMDGGLRVTHDGVDWETPEAVWVEPPSAPLTEEKTTRAYITPESFLVDNLEVFPEYTPPPSEAPSLPPVETSGDFAHGIHVSQADVVHPHPVDVLPVSGEVVLAEKEDASPETDLPRNLGFARASHGLSEMFRLLSSAPGQTHL